MQRRGNPRRQAQCPATTRREVNALRRELMGHPIVPAPNPQMYVQRPWNSWTFQRTDFTTAAFEAVGVTVKDIQDQIRGRCNINPEGATGDGNQISLRILTAHVWVTAASLILPDMETTFFELNPNDTAQSIRYTQRDVGTLNMPAKCGYAYPLNDSKEVFDSNDEALNVVATTPAAIGSQVTHRIQVLWRSSA